MLKEFREFAMKGNVVDLAVGVIIGAAFGAIVTSLVGDIIMGDALSPIGAPASCSAPNTPTFRCWLIRSSFTTAEFGRLRG